MLNKEDVLAAALKQKHQYEFQKICLFSSSYDTFITALLDHLKDQVLPNSLHERV